MPQQHIGNLLKDRLRVILVTLGQRVDDDSVHTVIVLMHLADYHLTQLRPVAIFPYLVADIPIVALVRRHERNRLPLAWMHVNGYIHHPIKRHPEPRDKMLFAVEHEINQTLLVCWHTVDAGLYLILS